MTNWGLLQHFPSSPIPAQGRAAPQHPQHPPASRGPQLGGAEGTSPLHECHLVGPQPALTPPAATPSSHSGKIPWNEHKSAFLTALKAPVNDTKTIGSAWKGEADSPLPHTPFWLRDGFGKSSTYLGDFFRSLLKVLHCPTVKSYRAAGIHFFE